jgi:hypothetical protein
MYFAHRGGFCENKMLPMQINWTKCDTENKVHEQNCCQPWQFTCIGFQMSIKLCIAYCII